MTELKVRTDTEADSSDQCYRASGHQQSTVVCVSEEDLETFVSLTPLSRTLQEIKESLQMLVHTHNSEEVMFSQVESEQTHFIPVALDNLSPQHFAVFLFGCHVVRLLHRDCAFPSVILLLAKTVPVSHCDHLLDYCNKDFYYDTANQILYIQENKLQSAGQFISVILHTMAYITSGSKPHDFMKTFHLAISALSMQLFHHSFIEDQRMQPMDQENTEKAFGTLVEDFVSVKIPAETHFAQHLLAERLQVYKYFKLEQLLLELKPTLTDRNGEGNRKTRLKTDVLCGEVDFELFSKLQSSPEKKQSKIDKPLQDQEMMVELQTSTVEQRLKEMKERLSKLSSSQKLSFSEETAAHTKVQAQENSKSPSKHKADSNGLEKQTSATAIKKQQGKHMDNDEERGMTA